MLFNKIFIANIVNLPVKLRKIAISPTVLREKSAFIFNLRSSLLFLLIVLSPVAIFSEQNEGGPKSEVGFWVGASNPFPNSPTAHVLDTTLGFGLFGRFQWPYIFYTEVGTYMANYLSQTERGLTTMPIYASMAYKLPLEIPVSIFLRAGGGMSYVIARPANIARWDPMSIVGTEISFVAGRKVRIGLRIDYARIYEKIGMHKPAEYDYPIYKSPYTDPRLSNPNYYKMEDAEFFHFSLMVSFLL